MKLDAGPDWDDGRGRAELRALLREWRAPEAPAGIEDALRRELRRRSRPRMGLWLPLAACLALAAVWAFVASRRPASPAEASPQVATARPIEPAVPKLEPAAPAPSRPVAQPRPPGPRPKEPAVIVEASQAELLAEFGRRAWETPELAPGAGIPASNGAEAPAYRGEWKEVAGVWPALQVIEPVNWR